MEVGRVPVRLLVRSDWHVSNVRMHGAIRQDQHEVLSTRTTAWNLLQLDGADVRNEVRFPHVVSRPDRNERSFAAEIPRITDTIVELSPIFEDESLVVEQVQHDWQVRCRNQPCRVPSVDVEKAILLVERYGEKAAWSPFEAVLHARGGFDLGRAMARQHVEHFLVQMMLRRTGAPRRKLDDEHIDEVAAACGVYRGA